MAQSKKKTSKSIAVKASSAFPAWLGNTRLHRVLVFTLSVCCYINTASLDYALDDAIVVYDNMFTTQGIEGIPGILNKDTFFGFFKEEGKAQLVAGGRYRPLSLITFAIEWELFAKKTVDEQGNTKYKGRPWLSHLINTLLFGLTVLLLHALLLSMLKQRFDEQQAATIAFVTTFLFAAHPIHTEVVANIKGRDEILALMGSVAALYYSLRAFGEKKIAFHFLAGFLFFLALLAKENAITFLAVIPLTYYFFTKAKISSLIGTLAPFVLASVLFLAIRFSILGVSIGEPPIELMNNPFVKIENNQWVPFSSGEKAATITFTLGKYVQLLTFPHPLSHDYYPRQIGIMNWGHWQVLLSLFLYLGLFVYAIWGLLKKDPISYAILFYFATLSIASNIIFPIGTNMSERLVFMPSVGFCLLLGVLFSRWIQWKKGAFKAAFAILGVVLVLFSLKTISRNLVWKDNFRLFTSDIEVSPNSAKLRNAAGGELIAQSTKPANAARQQNMLEEALGHLSEAVRIHPTYKNAWLLKGNAHLYLKQYDPAITAYRSALNIDPTYAEANNNLGIAYQEAGQYYGEQLNDLPTAISYLNQAYSLRPNDYSTVRLLGVANGMLGNIGKAVELFSKGTELAPDNASAWFDLGVAHLNAQNTELANAAFNRAKSIDPDIENKRRAGSS